MMRGRNGLQGRRAGFLLLLVAALVLAASSDRIHDFTQRLVIEAQELIAAHSVTGIVVFVALSALSAMMVFVSTAVFVPVAIYAWGRTATIVLLWIGWLAGGILSYVIGRYPGRQVLRWFVPRKRIEQFEGKISANASLPLIILFQLALPSEIPGYVLGAMRYRLVKYLIALAIAELPFAIGAVYLGASFLQRNYILLVSIGIVGAVFSVVAIYALNRRINRPEPPL